LRPLFPTCLYSYSINDNDQYILTLLSSKLREKNFNVNTSLNFYGQSLDFSTKNEIQYSNLFIGILTGQGIELDRVVKEFRFAQSCGVPNLLMIEDTVNINPNFRGNYILFNRYNPQNAINEINRRMNPQPSRTTSVQTKKSSDLVPWVLGGVALLAILSALSSDKE